MAIAANKHSRRFVELACICFAIAQLGWFVFPNADVMVGAELALQDKALNWTWARPTTKDFVFVAIDDPSLKLELWPEDIEQSRSLKAMVDGWPWPRPVYADALTRILSAGAKLVLFDLILDASKPGDEELKAVLDRFPKQVVLGANLSFDTVNPDHPELAKPTMRMPSPSLIPNEAGEPRIGFVNFFPEPADKKIRSALYQLEIGTHRYFSLSSAAARQLGKAERIPSEYRPYLFRYLDLSSIRMVPFYTLFIPQDWKHRLQDGAVFKDKIVVIGPSAAILHDIHLTPGDVQLPGPLLHVNALAALLDRNFYNRASTAVTAAYVFAASLIALWLTLIFRNRPMAALGALLGSCGAMLLVAYVAANGFNYLLPIVQPDSVLLMAGVACIAWNFARERRESGRMRSMLDRYISRNLVSEVLDQRDDFLNLLGGARRPVIVFFSDVRNFTSFAEREDATAVVEQLNEYLGEMVGIIFRHHGTVDKFMGDGIMAVWGNVLSEGKAKDAAQAVNAALEMLDRLSELNAAWSARGLPSFQIGIGMHYGSAVFGNVGSAEKMEMTVIGNTVNLASRVEGLTKQYGVPLCITQSLAEILTDHFLFRSVDLVQVVGKSHPVEILTIIGKSGSEIPAWIKCYEGAITDFRARRFVEAAAALRLCLEAAPDDKLCAMYLGRATAFMANPPSEDWNGAEIATSK